MSTGKVILGAVLIGTKIAYGIWSDIRSNLTKGDIVDCKIIEEFRRS